MEDNMIVPINEKLLLTIKETALYSNIGILWWLGLGHWTILGALIPAALALLWQRRDVRIRQAMGEKLA